MIKYLAFLTLQAAACLTAHAEADGPDHYQVSAEAPARGAALRASASNQSRLLGRLPAGSLCLRNLGCKGGLSFAEHQTLSPAEQARKLKAHPRWCKVEQEGRIGWIEGRWLSEGACPKASEPVQADR